MAFGHGSQATNVVLWLDVPEDQRIEDYVRGPLGNHGGWTLAEWPEGLRRCQAAAHARHWNGSGYEHGFTQCKNTPSEGDELCWAHSTMSAMLKEQAAMAAHSDQR